METAIRRQPPAVSQGLGRRRPGHRLASAARPGAPRRKRAGGEFVPNAFLRIAPDNTVTVISKHIEFGQGPYTGIATILADELDADWAQIRVESAPADVKLYANSAFGAQGTGGSTAMANSWDQLRNAGAEARARLIAAAAKQWDVDAGEITIEKGVVKSSTGKAATFGELAQAASETQPIGFVKPKDPSAWRLIGTRVPEGRHRAEDERHGAVHHRREAARHADRASSRIPSASARRRRPSMPPPRSLCRA